MSHTAIPSGIVAPESVWLLGELASELSGTQSLAELQALLSRKLRWVIDFDRCTLAIRHRADDLSYELLELTNPTQSRQWGSRRVPLGQDPISQVLHTSKPQYLLTNPITSGHLGIIEEAESVILLPLRVGSHTVGSLNLSARRRGIYSMGMRNLVMLLATQIGGHLGSLLSHQQTRISLAQQAAVAELGQQALAQSHVDQVFAQASERVRDCLGVATCQVWTGSRSQSLGIRASSGWPVVLESLTLNPLDLLQGTLPIRLKAAGLQSGVGIPFAETDSCLHILAIHDTEPRHFNSEDLNFLQSLALTLETALLRKQAEDHRVAIERAAQLETQMQEMERLSRLKDEFLSTVSHELRTPLASVKLAIRMLQSSSPTPQQLRYITILDNECLREINLVNDLLDLQQLEQKDATLSIEPLEIRSWLTSFAPNLSLKAHDRQQTLTIEAPDQTVLTDRANLEPILQELVINATKFSPPQSQIQVSATVTSHHLVLQVANPGHEILPEEQERIFDKFYRIPQSDPWAKSGTGLGLALVKKRLDCLKGSIQVTRQEDLTVFTVRIPVQVPEIVAPPTPAPPEDPGLPVPPSLGWGDGWDDPSAPVSTTSAKKRGSRRKKPSP